MPSTSCPVAIDLDHVTIVTPRVDALRDFFRDVVGLQDGPRPPFHVDGHWIHANGRAVIHLVDATVAGGPVRSTPRIDHLALRVHDAREWQALVARVAARHLRHAVAAVPLTGEQQLFVELDANVVVEFVTALQPTAPVHPLPHARTSS